jgi:hypothetical protein
LRPECTQVGWIIPWIVFYKGYASCLWRIVISPMIPQDSPSCYDFAIGNLVVLSILWFAKASAETQDGAVLARVVAIIASIEQSFMVGWRAFQWHHLGMSTEGDISKEL